MSALWDRGSQCSRLLAAVFDRQYFPTSQTCFRLHACSFCWQHTCKRQIKNIFSITTDAHTATLHMWSLTTCKRLSWFLDVHHYCHEKYRAYTQQCLYDAIIWHTHYQPSLSPNLSWPNSAQKRDFSTPSLLRPEFILVMTHYRHLKSFYERRNDTLSTHHKQAKQRVR